MSSNQLISYLPTFAQIIRENIAIFSAEQSEIDDIWQFKSEILNSFFISTAYEYGVERYESIMDILPTPTETLEQRKFNILVKLNEQLPYTMKSLAVQLEELCGVDGYQLILDAENYTLEVKIAISVVSNFDAVCEMIAEVIPCNLISIISLMYEQYSNLTVYTHGYLADYSHQSIRNEEVTNGDNNG